MDVPLHGAVWFRTMSPAHADLNDTVLATRSIVDSAAGTIRATGQS